jgi:hypothetical protein
LDIENKTHLELNKYELKWNEKEILSLILKIFISRLTDDELEKINLLFIVKNRKNDEVIEDMDKIIKAIYQIFGKKPTFITYKTLNEYKFTNNKIPNNHLPNTPK